VDFRLSSDQSDLQLAARDLARGEFGPLAEQWDKAAELLPDEARKRLGDLGYLGMTLPEEYGGWHAPLLDALLVLEEFGKECLPAAFAIFEAAVGAVRVIELLGTPEQRERWLPPIAAGDATMAVAISEADAGSAATDMRTKARIEGDELVLNGSKRWSSGAGHAEQYLIYCRLSDDLGAKGIGAVVVDKGTPGLTFGPREIHLGFRSVAHADIFLDECRVPLENLVVPAGGFGSLFRVFSIERMGNATMSLAMAQAALDRCKTYVIEREQFGRPIADFQGIQIKLADMLMRTEAARMLNWRAAANAGTGYPVTLEVSLAKCYANEVARDVTTAAMEIYGGYGYSSEYPIERYLRDSFGWIVAGGTPTMQRIRIASELLGRRVNQRVS
jgi:alkylation response protein AidB-like acyl-CoA dehydrogenase